MELLRPVLNAEVLKLKQEDSRLRQLRFDKATEKIEIYQFISY